MEIPSAVEADLAEPLSVYWRKRLEQHTSDSYADVPLSKFPEDLRLYEHLLWESRATAVIELGAQFGGSALWFRDRLVSFARYREGPDPLVISVDLDLAPAREALATTGREDRSIVLLEGDVRDAALADEVERLLPAGVRCLVSEDSAHLYDTTFGALQGYARFVPPGGFFVVEDGCVDVDALRIRSDWPRGVLPAVRDWLETDAGADFHVRRDLELYGVTCHPEGCLQHRGP